jgi:phage terminase Nu1 subunit (DNA packaging protein)
MVEAASIITKAQLAELLGVSRPRVSQFVGEGLPVRVDGRLDREVALAWLRQNATTPRLHRAAGGQDVWLSDADIERICRG